MEKFSPSRLTVADFKNAGEGYLYISDDGFLKATPDRRLIERIQASNSHTNQRTLKLDFNNALVATGEIEIVKQALIQVNLTNYFEDDRILLHSREVKTITNAASEYWKNKQAANNKTEGLSSKQAPTQPITANQNTNSAERVALTVSTEKSGGAKTVNSQDPIAKFKRTFPHLANFESFGKCGCIEEVEQVLQEEWKKGPRLSTTMPLLYHSDRKYLTQVIAVIKAIKNIQGLFVLTAITPEGWNKSIQELDVKINLLSECLKLLADYSPTTQTETSFHQCLRNELTHQIDLLTKKKVSRELMRDSDPVSEQRVAYWNYILEKVAFRIFNDAQESCSKTTSKNCPFDNFTTLRASFEKSIARKKEIALEKSITRVDFPEVALIEGIPSKQKDDHPVNKTKKYCLDTLHSTLREAGLSDKEIETQFTEEKIVLNALRQVLNGEIPPNYQQTIVASINGVTDYFGIGTSYIKNFWVSSAETATYGIPRNFKIHRLTDSQGQSLATVVSQGVNDMWGIPDKKTRAASNAKSADKVACVAAEETNPRVVQKCNQGIKPKMTQLSILLVTPTGLTQNAVIKKQTVNYHEKDYTKAQFAAFQTVNDQGSVLVNGHPVDVDIITFSFGINKLATGDYNGKFTGGWGNVDDHNHKSMERLIGKLEKNKVHKVGGFIGHVMDLIEASSLPTEEKWARINRLQQHTDIVCELFLREEHKQSDGDPAKMPREVIVLQAYAEMALNAINSDEVATISGGCKSAKDRWMIVLTEAFHELIIENLGGSIAPGETMNDEMMAIYLDMAPMQFANQTANTGLPGNKAIGRKIDKDAQVYLTGLSPFAKE